MNKEFMKTKEEDFFSITSQIMKLLTKEEELIIDLNGEKTTFVRINNSKIRQIIEVDQYFINIVYISQSKSINYKIPFTFDYEVDLSYIEQLINQFREEIKVLPKDPFIVYPENHGVSSENNYSEIENNVLQNILEKVQHIDFVGLVTTGYVIKANTNSKGQKHWFSTDSFYVDFSIYSQAQHAVKSIYAGSLWEPKKFIDKIREAENNLNILQQSEKILSPNKYRTYFAPQAVNELLSIFSYRAVSMNSFKLPVFIDGNLKLS